MKPSRKLKKPQASYSKLELEEIIGLTVTNRNTLASSSSNDSKFVYTAGCVVVIYDVDLGTQSHLMLSNRSPKPLGCVAVSQDGTYIAAGESGHQPAIIVWSSATLAPISELKGHRYGVACTAFSPDGKHLVSVGIPQDGNLCVWDWRSGLLVKKLKTCSPFSDVSSVSFSADASSILTAGKRHIKIWAVGLSTKSRAKTEAVSLTMLGKHVNLGQYKGCTFVDITSPIKINGNVVDEKGGDSVLVYALTSSGVLCVLHGGLTITHSVNLEVEKAYALSTSQEFISCACNNGIVKLYTVGSLEYAGELPYSEDKQSNNTTNTQLATFPDAIACHFSTSEKLVVVYRDCSLYIWNIHGKFQATKCCVLVSHGGCIWDIKNLSCENMHDSSLACVARGCTGGVSFATCSADRTIRLWDMTLQSVSIESRSTLSAGPHHVITEPLDTLCIASAGTFEHESVASGVISKGYRAMAASSDGKYLAAGDSDGNLHIFDLFTSDYKSMQDSHKGEVLSLSFSLPVNKSINSAEELENYYFLASGGHDKRIHLFDVKRNFDLVASIDDHLAAVSSVKLTGNGRRIITRGSDRSLIFCDVAGRNDDYNISLSHQQKTSHGTINDIALDTNTQIAVTVGQDKKINMFDIASGQVIRSFKQGGDFGDPIKVALDASCSYVACSYSDKSICVYDFVSGEMAARAMGHGEAITGIIFLSDCKHLVSVGSDGCIFVWKVPAVLTSRMLQRIKESSCPLSLNTISQCTATNPNKCCEKNYLTPRFTDTPMLCEGKGLKETPTFRYSVSRLPQWAKSKVTSPFVIPLRPASSEVVGLERSPSISIDEGNDHDNLALHTPSNYNDLSNSKGSTTLGSCRSFALDNRWLTIHTVCLDLSSSPEVFNMKKQMVPCTSNSPQCPALEATDNESVKPPAINISLNHTSSNSNCGLGQAGCINVHIGLNDSGCLSYQYQLNNACVSGEEYGHENSEQLQLSASDNQVANKCILNSVNNSPISKIEYPSLTEQGDSKRGSSNQQGMNLLNKDHTASQRNSCSSSSMSSKVKTAKINDQQECEIMRDEKQMTFNACKEALRSLDTSSKIALEAFSKLRDIQSTYKNSEGPDSRFYSEAAELLPSIAKNVHEIAKFASLCGCPRF